MKKVQISLGVHQAEIVMELLANAVREIESEYEGVTHIQPVGHEKRLIDVGNHVQHKIWSAKEKALAESVDWSDLEELEPTS